MQFAGSPANRMAAVRRFYNVGFDSQLHGRKS